MAGRSTSIPRMSAWICIAVSDAVIPPSHTRLQVAQALRLLDRKVVEVPAKKHGNIPL